MVGTMPTDRPDRRTSSRACEYPATVSKTGTTARALSGASPIRAPVGTSVVTVLMPPAPRPPPRRPRPPPRRPRPPPPRPGHHVRDRCGAVRPRAGHRRLGLHLQPPGQRHHGVVSGQLGAVAGQRGQGLPMALDRVPVPTGSGTGQCPPGPEVDSVLEGGPHQVGEGVEGQPGRRRHPLDLPDERHHVVGGDGCGGMVRSPVPVLDRRRPSAQCGHHGAGHRVPGHGEGDPRPEALGAGGRAGQGHQGVERPPTGVGVEDIEPQRSREVDHDGRLDGDDRRGHPAHLVVRSGDDQQVDPGGGVMNRVVAAERAPRLEVPHGVERRHE